MSIIQHIRSDSLSVQPFEIPAGLQISPAGDSGFGKYLPSEIAPRDASGPVMRPLPPGIAPGPPQINQGLLDATPINPGPPQINQGLLDATLINPGPPQIGGGFGQNSKFYPFPPDIAPRDASGSGLHPLPLDIAPSEASDSGKLVIRSQPPDFSGGIESKLSQIDLFYSMHSARAYALNSIVDVLDKGAYGTIV